MCCRLSNALKRGLEEGEGNQCTIITWQMLNVWFPQRCDRLQVPFYRTKVTSWMASMEEEYRFIIMEADASEDPNWAQLCVEQVWLHACLRYAWLIEYVAKIVKRSGSNYCGRHMSFVV